MQADHVAERLSPPESVSLLRWGIADMNQISRNFMSVLYILPANEHQLIAIAKQGISKSFTKTDDLPRIYNDYETLALDRDIDIVFIGTINSQRFDIAMLMLKHGKHVLCEAPMTMNWEQTKELIIYAQSRQLFLMEAVANCCFPAYDFIREEVASDNIGHVHSVNVYVGFNKLNANQLAIDQMNDMLMDHIILGVQFVCLVYNNESPIDILVSKKKDSVNESIMVMLFYEGMIQTATILIFMMHSSHLLNEARIYGNYELKVPQFWFPIEVEVSNRSKPLIFPIPQSDIDIELNFSGFSYESPKMTHNTSLLLARLKAEIREKLDMVNF